MSNTLHPISIRMMFEWRKANEICVKWRNCLKSYGMGKRSLTTNCSLVKYIMLFERLTNDKVSPFVSWIKMVSEIQKRAWNSCSDKSSIERFGLECPTLAFFCPPCWGLPLVEVTPPLSIRSYVFGLCGNLHGTTQLSEPITRSVRHSMLP